MPKPPRAAFVEAMKFLYETSAGGPQGCPDAIDESIRAACEAFADATCGINHTLRKDIGADDMHHDTCRAALLKEVFDD